MTGEGTGLRERAAANTRLARSVSEIPSRISAIYTSLARIRRRVDEGRGKSAARLKNCPGQMLVNVYIIYFLSLLFGAELYCLCVPVEARCKIARND